MGFRSIKKSPLKKAIRIAYWPAGFGFFVGASGVMKGTAEGKFLFAVIMGFIMAVVFGVIPLVVAYLFFKYRERKSPNLDSCPGTSWAPSCCRRSSSSRWAGLDSG